ncbi:MAG TPA: SUMF1/EgtB/PvdO family nonheme iron enzyme [Polyangiaceae bacterium]
MSVRERRAFLAVPFVLALACESDKPPAETKPSASSAAAATSVEPAKAPALLYLPDGGDVAIGGGRGPPALVPPPGACPAEMVDVGGRFCIDRYEASLVDARLGRGLSPYFPARRSDAVAAFEMFRDGPRPIVADAPELPIPPAFELSEAFGARAMSRAGVVPNGYVSGIIAGEACRAAGKRLCTLAEWTVACRGEKNRRFPYGDDYADGACNVGREAHPASVLHGDASIHHLDPRLNLVQGSRGPLLRKTGETASCRSEWSGDAAFDMVGNLDEWIDDAEGTFVGGFYARATRDGCDAKIEKHPLEYFDYSTGVRCCR